MNQILATQMSESTVNNIVKEENNYKPTSKIDVAIKNPSFKEPRASSGTTKKIIIVFSIIIIIFALGIVGFKAYQMYTSPNNKEEKIEVQISPKEDSGTVSIAVKSEIGINKIQYYWEENNIESVQINGKTEYEKMIDIPYGTNILTVIVMDINNIEHTYTQEVIGPEVNGPKITLSVIQDEASVKITATDENGINYMEYYWDDNQPTKITPETEEDNTTLETTIEVLKGTHTLTIYSINTLGKETTETKDFAGKNKPEVSVIKHGAFVDISVSHESGFKKVEIILNNGEPYVYDNHYSKYDSQKTKLDFPDVELIEGKNNVKINAYSMEDTVTNYEGECEYIP